MDQIIVLGISFFLISFLVPIFKKLGQSIITSILVAGIILGPYFLNIFDPNYELWKFFSELGILILLFLLGLGLDKKTISQIGKSAFILGISQIVFTSLVGFLVCYFFLGFNIIPSMIISVALSFSSTIVIAKLLNETKNINKVIEKLIIGFLIIQDIFVAFSMVVFSTIFSNDNISGLSVVIKFISFFILVILFKFTINKLFNLFGKYIVKNKDLFFILSISFLFLISAIFDEIGFSKELGALFAGFCLSNNLYKQRIIPYFKSIRDFFIIFFFLLVGSSIAFDQIKKDVFSIILLSLFIIIGNPLIVFFIMKKLGYSTKNSFIVCLTVAQISEFSLVLILFGYNLGLVPKELFSIVSVIGLITITISSYLILNSEKLYWMFLRLMKFLGIHFKDETPLTDEKEKYNIVIFGCGKIGYDILKILDQKKKDYIIYDSDPEVIEYLTSKNINCSYFDPEIDEEYKRLLNNLDLTNIKLILSEVDDIVFNITLLRKLKKSGFKGISIFIAKTKEEAIKYYKEGANYVLTPYFLGGHFLSELILKYGYNKKNYDKEKKKHLDFLDKMNHDLNHRYIWENK